MDRDTQEPRKIKKRTVRDRKAAPDPEVIREQEIGIMMKRLFTGASGDEIAAEVGLSPRAVDNRIANAKRAGVPEIARKIFISEFLPMSMARLKEALAGDDLKLAVQVALKVVQGLEIMENPEKLKERVLDDLREPESLEAWRVKFKKAQPAIIEVEDPQPTYAERLMLEDNNE